MFNKFGIVAVVIDVVAYLDDHHHDDRYYTQDEINEQRAIDDLEIIGFVDDDGSKEDTGPFTSSRTSTGLYSIQVSGLIDYGIPYSRPITLVTLHSSCAAGATAIANVSSWSGSPLQLNAFSVRVEIYDAANNPVDCRFQFNNKFKQGDTLPDLTAAPSDASNDASDSRVECVDSGTEVACTGP